MSRRWSSIAVNAALWVLALLTAAPLL